MANLPVFSHLTSDVHLKANYTRFPSKTSDIRAQVKSITSDVKTSNPGSLSAARKTIISMPR